MTWWPSGHQWTNVFLMYNLCIAQCSRKWFFFKIVHIRFYSLWHTMRNSHYIRYIDPARHDYDNCLLPWFSTQSCLGRPLAARPAQEALCGKSWKEKISKLWREGSMYLYVMWRNLTFQTFFKSIYSRALYIGCFVFFFSRCFVC